MSFCDLVFDLLFQAKQIEIFLLAGSIQSTLDVRKVNVKIRSGPSHILLHKDIPGSKHPSVNTCAFQLPASSGELLSLRPSPQAQSLGSGAVNNYLWRAARGASKHFLASNCTAMIKLLFLSKLHYNKWHNDFEVRNRQKNHNLWIWSFWFVSTGDISKQVGAQRLQMASFQTRQALKLKREESHSPHCGSYYCENK